MTYIKIIFVLVLLLLEKCHIINKQTLTDTEKSLQTHQVVDKNDLKGTWLLAEVDEDTTSKKEEDVLLADAQKKKAVQNGMVISFFPDSTFTKIYGDGRYQFGRYSIHENMLTLTDRKEVRQLTLTFAADAYDRRTIQLRADKASASQTFSEYTRPLEKFWEDPFHSKNNTWRLKPTVAENDKQLEARVINYIQHNCYILKAATDRDQAIVSWQFSEGIIRIYNGGIGIVSTSYIPQSWIKTFYSKEDAMKAYNLYESYLRANSYKGANTGKWVKDDYNILISIYAQAKKLQKEKPVL